MVIVSKEMRAELEGQTREALARVKCQCRSRVPLREGRGWRH